MLLLHGHFHSRKVFILKICGVFGGILDSPLLRLIHLLPVPFQVDVPSNNVPDHGVCPPAVFHSCRRRMYCNEYFLLNASTRSNADFVVSCRKFQGPWSDIHSMCLPLFFGQCSPHSLFLCIMCSARESLCPPKSVKTYPGSGGGVIFPPLLKCSSGCNFFSLFND